MKIDPPRLVLAALMLAGTVAISTASALAQQPCSTSATSGCVAVPGMSTDLRKGRLDRTLATNPGQDRVRQRLDTETWTADGNVTTPFVVNPGDTTTSMQTSLQEWRAALTDAERKKLEEARKTDETLKLPKPVQHAAPPVDVWVSTRRQSLDVSGDAIKEGDATTTYVGADYRASSNLLVGGIVQMDEAKQGVVTAPESVEGNAYMAGPYAAYRVTDKVIVDAKSTWGRSEDAARAGSEAASYATDRSLNQARVSGNWGIRKWQLTPSGAVTHITEEGTVPVAGVDATKIEETRISVRPELKRPIQAPNGNTVEPFAFFESSLDVDDADLAVVSPQNTVGGGLAITKSNAYNIRATAGYTETLNAQVDPSVTGRVSVNVPLGAKP